MWLGKPHVARWFHPPEGYLEWATLPPAGGTQALITREGSPIGYLRWQRIDRETLDALGLQHVPSGSVDADLLIGEYEHVRRGYGTLALKMLIARLAVDVTVPLIGLTTSVENHAASRAFEQAGFRISCEYRPAGFSRCYLMTFDLDVVRLRI
jgi:RimJ/RimL family protein N-acetyltransferase